MRGKHNLQCLVGAAICAVAGWSRPLPDADGFHIVSVGFSDALPGWHRSVLEVKPDGGDLVVRYILVVPAGTGCWEDTKIVAVSTRLPDTAMSAITGGLNVCAIEEASLSRTLRAFPRTQGMSVFAGDRFAIVASCGADTRVIALPPDWELDMVRLKGKRPKIAALWTLEKTIGTRAFGPFRFLDVVPSELAARLQPAGDGILAELKSGRFDPGLASIAQRSFRDDVAKLHSDSDPPEFSVTLANAARVQLDRYVEPQYPPIAKQAHLSGAVELELRSSPATGEMEQVTVISGNALLAMAATEAAQRWRVLPGPDHVLDATRVVLEFASHCR
jgi:TonB-like protein